jgi:hypothetical protein
VGLALSRVRLQARLLQNVFLHGLAHFQCWDLQRSAPSGEPGDENEGQVNNQCLERFSLKLSDVP